MATGYKLNGQDLDQWFEAVQIADGVIAPLSLVQQDYSLPGRPGVVPADRMIGPRTVTLGGLILGAGESHEAMKVTLEELALEVSRPDLSIGRTIDGRQDWAPARYLGGLETSQQLAAFASRASMSFSLLDGYWRTSYLEEQALTPGTAFPLTIPTDIPTPHVYIGFTAAAGSTPTFTALGGSVEVTSWTGGTGILHMYDWTAQDDNGQDISSKVTSTGFEYEKIALGAPYWMALQGSESLTVTGVTSATVTIYGAVL